MTAATARLNTAPHGAGATVARNGVIAVTAFLTVVDLFATQAVLPMLAHAYRVTPAAISIAVNATTLGMAIAGLAVALFGRKLDRRRGIVLSLALLAIPTALLAHAPSLEIFAALRVAQGLCMATAFALTLARLGERCSGADQAAAFAAYVTGNVASNLFGRLIAANIAGTFGLATNFYVFAALNLAGAALAALTIHRAMPMVATMPMRDTIFERLRSLLTRPQIAGFVIGFCILFAFIAVFTFVNFVLVRPPVGLGMTALGLVYCVFAPAIVMTPLAGRVANRLGARTALWLGLGLAAAGVPLLASGTLVPMLAGMTMVGAGTFWAQAVTTGFVSRVARDKAAASGFYLAWYFAGGLAGTAIAGQVFERLGWIACLALVFAVLALAAGAGAWFGADERQSTGLPAAS